MSDHFYQRLATSIVGRNDLPIFHTVRSQKCNGLQQEVLDPPLFNIPVNI